MQAAMKAVSGLTRMVTADLNAAADYALKFPAANGKLAVVGFCWGGGKSFLFATQRKDLRAAFVFYGPPPPTESLAQIPAPVYGFYGGNDARITATVPATKDAMAAAGKKYEAGHLRWCGSWLYACRRGPRQHQSGERDRARGRVEAAGNAAQGNVGRVKE